MFDTRVEAVSAGMFRATEPNGSVRYYVDAISGGGYEAVVPRGETSVLFPESDGSFTRRYRDGSSETFNSSGYLTSVTDTNGNLTLLTRDNANLLTQITAPSGRSIAVEHDASSRIARMTLPDGGQVTYAYVNNNLQKVTYPDGTSKTYEYLGSWLYRVRDENGNVVKVYNYNSSGVTGSSADGTNERVVITPIDAFQSKVTDSLGRVTTYTIDKTGGRNHATGVAGPGCGTCGGSAATYEYDADLNVTSETDANGNVTRYTHDSAGNVLTKTEGYGSTAQRTTSHTYNELDQVLTTSSPDGSVVTNTYDAKGNLLSTTDGEGNRTSATYDGRGLRTSSTDPKGKTTTYEYDAHGNLVRTVNPLGQATAYTYDVMGRVLSVTSGGATTAHEYDARGRLKKTTAPDGGITAYEYDLAGNTTAVTDPLGNRTVSTYDAIGRLIKLTDPAANTSHFTYDTESNLTSKTIRNAAGAVTSSAAFTYDEGNRLARTTHPDGTYSEQTYDAKGNLKTRRDENGSIHTYSYDALDRIVSVTDPLGAVASTSYDANGRVAIVTLPNATSLSYTYRRDGRVASVASAEAGTTTYTYDANGNRATETDARGVTTAYEHDALNRLTRSRFPAPALDVVYSYDSCLNGLGRLCSMSDPSGVTTYEYDVAGRKVRETKVAASRTYVVTYAYDLAGNLASITYPSGRVISYTYSNGRVSSVRDDAATLASGIAHLPFGPTASVTLGNGLVESFGYDQRYRLASIASGSVRDLTYAYDASGNITAISDNASPGSSRSFGYDAVGRLTAANGPWGTLAYTYDAAGNRSSETSSTGSTSYAYSGNQLSATTGEKAVSFTYDLAGNATSMNDAEFVYSEAGRLVRVRLGGFVIADYVLDGNGRRAMKTTPTAAVVFLHGDDGRVLAEYTPAGALIAEYVYIEGRPLAKLESGAAYYYHNDQVGTPQKMTNASGQVAWALEMLPFGETRTVTGSAVNNLRFPGQYYDEETGLHQNWFREYSPTIGRYLAVDPLVTNPRLPGQYDERLLGSVGLQGPYYNWNEWYLPRVGRYLDLDPVALQGGANDRGAPDWYNYALGNPNRYVDPEGRVAVAIPVILWGAGAIVAAWETYVAICTANHTCPWDKPMCRTGPPPPSGPKKDCDAQYRRDTDICSRLPNYRDRNPCHASAMTRLTLCQQGQPEPPLYTGF